MKKIYILIAFCALLVGCTDNDSAALQQEGNSSAARRGVSVQFTLSDGVSSLTRATNDTVTTPALEREKAVRNLYAVVFNASDSTFYETFIAHKKDSLGTYGYDMLQPGEYLMYLVANPADSLAARLERGVPKADSLSRMLIEQAPGNDNEATDFLMTAEGRSFKTGVDSIANVGTIKMVRAAARFDFYNRVPLLRLTRITFNNRYTTARLSTPLSTSAQAKENRGYYFFSDSTGHDIIATMYGYENLDAPATTSFTVEGFYNGVAIKPYTIQFPADKQIRRNMLYSIVLSPKEDVDSVDVNNLFGSLEYDIVVNDWSEGADFNWIGENLFDRTIPNFYVSGTDIHANSKNYCNPTKVYVETTTAKEIILDVESPSTSSIVRFYGKNKYGYEIVDTFKPTDRDGKMHQKFVLKIPDICHANDTTLMNFMVCNKLDKTQRRIFTVIPRPKLPLEYMAEYNIKTYDTSNRTATFATSNTYTQNRTWMTWTTAYNTMFTSSNKININGIDYHLPYHSEWMAIFDWLYDYGTTSYYTSSNHGVQSLNYTSGSDRARIRNTYYNNYTYLYTVNNICYAISFWDSSSRNRNWRCAYRFQWKNYGIEIKCRYLGPNYTTYDGYNIPATDSWSNTYLTSYIAREAFWNNQSELNIVRVIPACGTYNGDAQNASSATWYETTYGSYLCHDYFNTSYCYKLDFYYHTTSGYAWVTSTSRSDPGPGNNASYASSVRLFSDY